MEEKAKSAARRALVDVLSEWGMQVTGDSEIKYGPLAGKMDVLLDTLADYIETRSYGRPESR